MDKRKRLDYYWIQSNVLLNLHLINRLINVQIKGCIHREIQTALTLALLTPVEPSSPRTLLRSDIALRKYSKSQQMKDEEVNQEHDN